MIDPRPYFSRPNNLQRIRRLRVIALLPVLLAAIANTGYQYVRALDLNNGSGAGGWREGLIQSFGFNAAEPGIYGIVIAGIVHVLSTIFIATLAGGILERMSCSSQHRKFDSGILYTALVFSLLMPPAASVFHIVFGMTLGLLLGQLIFGGEGKSFLSPALVGVAIVQISFPGALTSHSLWNQINGYAGTSVFDNYHTQGSAALVWADIDWWHAFAGNIQGLLGTTSTLAILIGAVILIYGRLASWRILLGQVIGLAIAAGICNAIGTGILDLPWHWHLVLGSFAFGAVYIATDPSSSCATNSGRWLQGILIGLLVVLLRVLNPSHPDGVIPVLLITSMLAPTIDHIVIWFNIRRRASAHGG